MNDLNFILKIMFNKTCKFFILAAFGCLSIQAQEIKWLTMDQALAKQQENPKKIMIDMYTSWCGPCRLLDKNTFSNVKLAAYVNANFYAVKFNAEGNEEVNFKAQKLVNPNYDPAKAKRRNSQHQLAQYFGVSAYPTIVFLGEKAEFLAPIPGYRTAPQLELYLRLFGEDLYKTITSQADFNQYSKDFKPSF